MLKLLQLIQLADSAIPIGASSHSFGLETLTAEGDLTPVDLESFFADLMVESGLLEGTFCCAAYRLAQRYGAEEHYPSAHHRMNGDIEGLASNFCEQWGQLNQALSARKVAREGREASTTLGKRFLRLVATLEPASLFVDVLKPTDGVIKPIHHCTAFGLAGGALGLGEEAVILAYLQQSLTGLLSACQRLMPVGQMQAMALGWQLKPLVVRIAAQSQTTEWRNVQSFTPLLDTAGMRHANLPVRLFIS